MFLLLGLFFTGAMVMLSCGVGLFSFSFVLLVYSLYTPFFLMESVSLLPSKKKKKILFDGVEFPRNVLTRS